jgi:hypothetical protein
MDSFLTLVIALGGIATGIGAIWAALAARRQAQVSERLAQLTERRLTEQNERARLNLELDLLTRLADRFDSPRFLSRRRAAANYLIDNVFVEDDMVEVERLNRAGWDVCGFFEDVGHLQRVGVLQVESVWNSFGSVTRTYWPLCKPAIERLREERKVPTMYEEFEHLSRVVADLEHKWGIGPPTKEHLREVMEDETVAGEDEIVLGEEPPATTG